MSGRSVRRFIRVSFWLSAGCFGVVAVMWAGDAAVGPAGALAGYALVLVVPMFAIVVRRAARRAQPGRSDYRAGVLAGAVRRSSAEGDDCVRDSEWSVAANSSAAPGGARGGDRWRATG